jgi:putative alpha-1,2-mannosidase
LIGNDDCGQMSAWYIFSSLGFYPVNPVSGEFVIGAPQIPAAKIDVGNGKVFSMEAKNISEDNKYVEKIELNGKPYEKQTIGYNDIMEGASLVFYMTNQPKK